MRIKTAYVFAALATLQACKPPVGDSTTKSLDNLARESGEDLNVNDCSPTRAVDPAKFSAWAKAGLITGSAGSLEVLRRSLGGIEPVLSLFFSAHYRIDVRSDAAQACAAAAKAEQGIGAFDATERDAKKSIPGCWTRRFYRQGEAGSLPVTHAEAMTAAAKKEAISEEFVVVLQDDPTAIRHAALRTMAFVLFQRLSRLTLDQGAFVIGEKSSQFVAFENRLAVLMLQDQAGDGKAMASARKFLPSDVSSWPKAQIADKWKAYRAAEPGKAGSFEELVATEAVDSYYHCEKTKTEMKQDFASLFRVVDQELAPELASLVSGGSNAAVTQPGLGLTETKPSFGLCGGGLFPNMGCGQAASYREERYGAVFPRMSWAWGNPSGCGLFIRWNC